MKKLLQLILLLTLLGASPAYAQDSLFFYKSGVIVFSTAAYAVDSVTFVPLDYYEKYRSNVVFTDLKSNPLLTRFAEMVQIAGFEKKLDNTTIWAPVNSALSNVDLSDTTLVRKIVCNQIAPTKISIAGIGDGLSVGMLNTKKYLFKAMGSDYYLDSIVALNPNIYSANSIIHIMNGCTPYNLNIWEYITEGGGHDLMKAYVNSHSKVTSNATTGIYTTTNDLKDQLAFTADEFSNGSAIIPTDEAWTDAYTKLYPYCAVPSDGLTDSQAEATKSAIIHNNFFTAKLNPALTDTTYTATSGYQLKSPAVMLDGAQTKTVSNGTCFTVNQLKMFNPEYWNKEIRLEAEDVSWGRTIINYSANVMSGSGTGLTVSNNKYIVLTSTTMSSVSALSATFPIPNTLSAKYNIYCVFLPSTVSDVNNQRPNKVKFYLSYMNNKSSNGTAAPSGVQVTNAPIDATNTVLASGTSAVFITNPATITKMLVAKEFTFPFSNLIYSNASKITVALKVLNAAGVTGTELTNYNRDLRIDCIILEPVQ
ncbi:MAG: hypothetical protein QM800_01915 [Paludibacter sp.]